MSTVTITKGSMSRDIPDLQTTWDSTCLSDFKRCPKLYEYRHVRNLAPKAPSVHLIFGQELHSALELYDRYRVAGSSHDDAQDLMVDYILRRLAAIAWPDNPKNKTKDNLLLACIWYTEQFKDDPAQTVVLADGSAAVELSFKVPTGLKAPDGEEYYLSGHIDRIVNYAGDYYITDRKTTSTTISDRYFADYTPHNQMTLYSLAAKIGYNLPIRGVLIDAIQLLANGARFQRCPIRRTTPMLNEWLEDFSYWIGQAEIYADAQHWPHNDTACSMYGGCAFQRVCSHDPVMREEILRHFYETQVWDPTVPRKQESAK